MKNLKKNELRMVVGGDKKDDDNTNNCACETLPTLNSDNILELITKSGPDCMDLCCEVHKYKKWTWFSKKYYANGECM